jgi:hypothetical protein
MSKANGKRLPGIDCRLELTNKFMLRTLRKARARVAEVLMEMARIKELSVELDSFASPEDVPDEALAIQEFTELSDAIIEYCLKVRATLDGPFVKVPAGRGAARTLPPDPSKN